MTHALLSTFFTWVAAVVVAIVALIAIAALGHLEKLAPGAPGVLLFLGKLLSYALLGAGGAAAAATLYRYGPSREKARWSWITPGSLFAALCWLLLTFGFGIYVAEFGNYNATYGSLGAVVVLLTWLYLSSYVLLFGAELNSELEHQTSADTTDGAAEPLGGRGAWAADHVATNASPEAEDTVPDSDSDGYLADLPPPKLSTPADLLSARVSSRLGSLVGFKKVGMISSALATVGLPYPGGGVMRSLEEQVAALGRLSSAELKDQWRRLTATPLPRISPSLLRLALAWEVQARALGGLSRATQQKLEQVGRAKTATRGLQPGMRLVRAWNGKAHVVTVGEGGAIRWDGRDWQSLSAVATAITGTRWSGPAFFGLKKKIAA